LKKVQELEEKKQSKTPRKKWQILQFIYLINFP
jgi:hypothetical protein